MITLLALAEAGLLAGVVHLIIVLIVIAILYFIGAAIIPKLTSEGIFLTLWMCLCAVIALYFVVTFLLALAP